MQTTQLLRFLALIQRGEDFFDTGLLLRVGVTSWAISLMNNALRICWYWHPTRRSFFLGGQAGQALGSIGSVTARLGSRGAFWTAGVIRGNPSTGGAASPWQALES